MANPSEFNLTKGVITVIHGCVVAAILWAATSISQNEVAYARIEERLQSQQITLVSLQQEVSKALELSMLERKQNVTTLTELRERVAKLEAAQSGQ